MDTTAANVETLLPSQGRLYLLKKKYKLFNGGVGSGKTRFGAMWSADQILHNKGNGMIVAPTYRMLEDVSLVAFLELLDRLHRPYEYKQGKNLIYMGNGTVFLRSGDTPDRLRGPNLSWAWLDEAALNREEVWKILIGRLRLNNARGLITTTPAGFNWIYHYWVELQHDSYGMVTGSSRENTYLDADFVSEMEASYSAEYAAQEIDGKFVTFEGLVYSEFSHDSDTGHIRTFDVKEDWQLCRGIDFGYTNPFVCLWGAIDGDGRLYIYDEHYMRKRLIKEHASVIKEVEGDFIWTVSDWDRQERAELEDAGVNTIKAQKDVSIGIQKVKSRLKDQPDGSPRLIVHPRCVNLIKEFGAYRWNPKAKGGKEEPVKEFDHAMDVVRYMVMELDGGSFVFI